MEITHISVLTDLPGTDLVILKTCLPSPVPGVTDEPMSCTFDVEHGKGLEYAQKNFPGIPITHINGKTGEKAQTEG